MGTGVIVMIPLSPFIKPVRLFFLWNFGLHFLVVYIFLVALFLNLLTERNHRARVALARALAFR